MTTALSSSTEATMCFLRCVANICLRGDGSDISSLSNRSGKVRSRFDLQGECPNANSIPPTMTLHHCSISVNDIISCSSGGCAHRDGGSF